MIYGIVKSDLWVVIRELLSNIHNNDFHQTMFIEEALGLDGFSVISLTIIIIIILTSSQALIVKFLLGEG